MFEVHKLEFLLEAETPIAHHQESIGNTAIAQRRKVRQPDGSFSSVPTINADTMRHGLREAGASMFLDAAGLLSDGNLTRSALRLLYNGGMVSGRGDTGSVSLDRYREMIELCPPLALLGGCCDSRVIPGRLFVSDGILVCAEQQHFLPEWVTTISGHIESCRSHVEEQTRVRMDSLLDPAKRKLLTSGEQVAMNAQLEASERAHTENDALAREESKSSMLPRSFESIVQGSLFYWSVTAQTTSDLDVDTLNVMLAAFLYSPQVGGKKATGHGKLRVVKARQVDVRRPADRADMIDTATLGQRCGSLFRAHVAERKARIATWLQEIDA